MTLTPQQCTFFESFGYLILPGLLTDDIEWIIQEHQKVFEQNGIVHDGTKRSFIVPFIDESERLCTLLDHPNVVGVLSSLLTIVIGLRRNRQAAIRRWSERPFNFRNEVRSLK
jgi:hypothetical protein